MKHAITSQLKELKYVRVSQQVRAPLDISGALYESVRGWVSHQALRKVQEQRLLHLKPHHAPCSHTFTSSHGLPCSHTLKQLEDGGQSLTLHHFHPHWHLKRDVPQPLQILEPRRAIDQFDHRRTQPVTSTGRELCAFERVGDGRRGNRKCGRCGIIGHIKTSKDCPLRPDERPIEELSVDEPVTLMRTAERQEHPSDITEEADGNPPSIRRASAVRSHRALSRPSDILSEHECETIVEEPPAIQQTVEQGSGRYDSPEAIYRRYVSARSAWYATLPRGALRTNQEYRRAKGLPQRYGKQSYEWCLDYKQMSRRCITTNESRECTTEEKMAYLDWSKEEDKRVQVLVAQQMGSNQCS